MFKTFWMILKRDLKLALRRRSEIFTVLFFFIIVVSLFPLGVGFDEKMLQSIASGVAWIAALLASMLALERLFSSDYVDGTLEQMLLTPQPLPVLVFAKMTAHWLLTGLPLVLIAPVVGILYHLEAETVKVMMFMLLLGTPILSMVGAIGAALTLGLRGGGVLISLLILPLYIPVLVYGAGAINESMLQSGNIEPYTLLLSAFLLLSLIFSPWATAAALKISLE
ncbi:MAG TPA: heme exporter protein CcmB [Gammaproteobacteria bacterium]|nr:heme exporter protein CcmB [Gammaproteobacteria bacterium]